MLCHDHIVHMAILIRDNIKSKVILKAAYIYVAYNASVKAVQYGPATSRLLFPI